MTPERFGQVVRDVVAELPAKLRTRMGAMPVLTRDSPATSQPADTEIAIMRVDAVCIELYQSNIDLAGRTEEETRAYVRSLLIEELAFYFGLEELEVGGEG